MSCPLFSIFKLLVIGKMSLMAHVVLKRFFAVKMLWWCRVEKRREGEGRKEVKMSESAESCACASLGTGTRACTCVRKHTQACLGALYCKQVQGFCFSSLW